MSHLPIVSVVLRIYYILALGKITSSLLHIQHLSFMSVVDYWLKAMVLIEKPSSDYFIPFCLPVYLADFFHTAIDFYDSFKAKRKFNSTPKEHRGLLAKIWAFVRNKK
jgi:hypothetical protein